MQSIQRIQVREAHTADYHSIRSSCCCRLSSSLALIAALMMMMSSATCPSILPTATFALSLATVDVDNATALGDDNETTTTFDNGNQTSDNETSTESSNNSTTISHDTAATLPNVPQTTTSTTTVNGSTTNDEVLNSTTTTMMTTQISSSATSTSAAPVTSSTVPTPQPTTADQFRQPNPQKLSSLGRASITADRTRLILTFDLETEEDINSTIPFASSISSSSASLLPYAKRLISAPTWQMFDSLQRVVNGMDLWWRQSSVVASPSSVGTVAGEVYPMPSSQRVAAVPPKELVDVLLFGGEGADGVGVNDSSSQQIYWSCETIKRFLVIADDSHVDYGSPSFAFLQAGVPSADIGYYGFCGGQWVINSYDDSLHQYNRLTANLVVFLGGDAILPSALTSTKVGWSAAGDNKQTALSCANALLPSRTTHRAIVVVVASPSSTTNANSGGDVCSSSSSALATAFDTIDPSGLPRRYASVSSSSSSSSSSGGEVSMLSTQNGGGGGLQSQSLELDARTRAYALPPWLIVVITLFGILLVFAVAAGVYYSWCLHNNNGAFDKGYCCCGCGGEDLNGDNCFGSSLCCFCCGDGDRLGPSASQWHSHQQRRQRRGGGEAKMVNTRQVRYAPDHNSSNTDMSSSSDDEEEYVNGGQHGIARGASTRDNSLNKKKNEMSASASQQQQQQRPSSFLFNSYPHSQLHAQAAAERNAAIFNANSGNGTKKHHPRITVDEDYIYTYKNSDNVVMMNSPVNNTRANNDGSRKIVATSSSTPSPSPRSAATTAVRVDDDHTVNDTARKPMLIRLVPRTIKATRNTTSRTINSSGGRRGKAKGEEVTLEGGGGEHDIEKDESGAMMITAPPHNHNSDPLAHPSPGVVFNAAAVLPPSRLPKDFLSGIGIIPDSESDQRNQTVNQQGENGEKRENGKGPSSSSRIGIAAALPPPLLQGEEDLSKAIGGLKSRTEERWNEIPILDQTTTTSSSDRHRHYTRGNNDDNDDDNNSSAVNIRLEARKGLRFEDRTTPRVLKQSDFGVDKPMGTQEEYLRVENFYDVYSTNINPHHDHTNANNSNQQYGDCANNSRVAISRSTVFDHLRDVEMAKSFKRGGAVDNGDGVHISNDPPVALYNPEVLQPALDEPVLVDRTRITYKGKVATSHVTEGGQYALHTLTEREAAEMGGGED